MNSRCTKAIAIAIAVFAALVGTPAQAAAPAPAPLSWTGFYVGGNVGVGWDHRNVSYSPNDPASALAFTVLKVGGDAFNSSAVLGGLQGGYNYQFDRRWLVGLEADFDWSRLQGAGTSYYQGNFQLTSAGEQVDWLGTVRARLGYLPAENLLAFVTGGFAYGKVDHTGLLASANGGNLTVVAGGYTVNCASPGTPACFAGSSSNVADGWTAGTGLEFAASRQWTIRAEYLYVSLDSSPLTEIAPFPTPGSKPSSYTANFGRTNINILRAALSYHF